MPNNSKLDHEKLWEIAKQIGKAKSLAAFPPHMEKERSEYEANAAIRQYRQMVGFHG